MKTHLLRISAIAVLGAIAGFAQSLATLRANVPFDFTVGKKTMPAGEYLVGPSLDTSVTFIRSVDGKEVCSAMGNPVASRKLETQARLIFHRYGNQYFLSEVWGHDGLVVPPTTRERELISQQKIPSSQTTVALR
jgi:hypothetical protein